LGAQAGRSSSGEFSTYLGGAAGYEVIGSNNIEISVGNNFPSASIIGSNSNKIHLYNTIVGDTSSRLYAIGNISSSNLTPDATLEILPAASTDIGLIVQGATSQSANLQEWQDSAGNTYSAISDVGNLIINTGVDIQIYNTGTDGDTDYERIRTYWDSDNAYIAMEKGGAGSDRRLYLGNPSIGAVRVSNEGDRISFIVSNTTLMVARSTQIMEMHSDLQPDFGDDNTFSIGSSTLRFANIYGVNVSGDYGIFDSGVTFPDGVTQTVAYTGQGGGSTSPGGSDTYVQFNDGGSFGGDANFTWND